MDIHAEDVAVRIIVDRFARAENHQIAPGRNVIETVNSFAVGVDFFVWRRLARVKISELHETTFSIQMNDQRLGAFSVCAQDTPFDRAFLAARFGIGSELFRPHGLAGFHVDLGLQQLN